MVDLATLQAFFDEHVHDRTGERIPHGLVHDELDIPAHVVTRIDQGELVAAAWASACPYDVAWHRNHRRFGLAQWISTSVMMVHDLAVLPAYRRTGVGASLLHELEVLATNQQYEVLVLIHDTTLGLDTFSERCGYNRTEPGKPFHWPTTVFDSSRNAFTVFEIAVPSPHSIAYKQLRRW